jgi:glycosyltransferase involved in cell wall biosynthesis
MLVQIFEPSAGGHHTSYIQALLPSLIELLDARQIREVVVTTSRSHRDSAAFQSKLLPYSGKVHFDASLPSLPHDLSSTRALASALLESIRRYRPDYLIATTADIESVALAVRAVMGRDVFPKRLHSVGLFHYGCAGMVGSTRDHFKDAVYRFSWSHSPWTEVQMVNPLLYEALKRFKTESASRIRVLPHPVERFAHIEKATARRMLGIPIEGRYLGYVGTLDRRKAAPELLAAFRDADLFGTDRLLLAGSMNEEYKALIASSFADLVAAQRIIILDRYLLDDEMQTCFSALDTAAVTYYPRTGLSASLLAAIAAQRPVIADVRGYTGMAIKRFGLGWTCNVKVHRELKSAIEAGFQHGPSYRSSEATARLLDFHDPRNYVNTVLGGLYERIGMSVPQVRTWEWATALCDAKV